MSESIDRILGRHAVERGWISDTHVAEALAEQERDAAEGRPPRLLGAILVARGDLGEARLRELLDEKARAALREEDGVFGAILVRNGVAAAAAVDAALAAQRDMVVPQRLGEILVERGEIDAQRLGAALQAQESTGTVLRTQARGGPVAGTAGETVRPSADAGAALPPPPDAGAASGAPGALRVFAGRYEVLRELGRGGMGVVYCARDRQLGREVALKCLLFAERPDPETIERFQREARAAAGLQHPGIVQVFDVGEAEDKPYYVMELVAGVELADLVRDAGVSPREAAEIVRQVAEALAYAHGRGILHRDIKPRNLVVLREGEGLTAKLLDFGLAKFAEREVQMSDAPGAGKSLRTLTRTGELMGTPAYMAPEQAEGAENADGRTDVYALGVSLYEMLTGRPPFADAATLAELLRRIVNEDPEPPRRAVPDVDADLETVCLKCLHKAPADRYASAAELAADCRRWLAGEPVAARPVGAGGRLWRRAKRNRAVAIPLATLTAVLLAAAIGWGTWAAGRALEAASARREADAILTRGEAATAAELDRAEQRALRVAELAPEDPEAKARVGRARAWQKYTDGRTALDSYRTQRAEADAVAARYEDARKAQEKAKRHAEKRTMWALERDAQEKARTAQESFAHAIAAFTEALGHWRDHPRARAALAELYWDRYLEAERARRKVDQDAYAALVRKLLPEVYGPLLLGAREIRVAFLLPERVAASDLRAHLFRFLPAGEPHPPVLAPVPCDPRTGEPLASPELGPTEPVPLRVALAGGGEAGSPSAAVPAEVVAARDGSAFPLRLLDGNRVALTAEAGSARFAATLPRGSYLLYLPPQGVAETRYPFEVARDRGWDEPCALPPEGEVPPLPPAMPGDSRRYWVFIPAGPYRASGDLKAPQTPPRDEGVIRLPEPKGLEGFRLARFEATTAMYLAYLNDRSWHTADQTFERLPRQSLDATGETVYFVPDATGAYRISPAMAGIGWTMEWPIGAISWEDSVDYCAWLTKTCGGGEWRFELPTEDEWEKAARGCDGRFFPWGDSFDPTFCNMRVSREGEQKQRLPEPRGLFPLDESPYGVRDLAGGMSECSAAVSGSRAEHRIEKGGSLAGAEALCRSAYRQLIGPRNVNFVTGFRVCARRTR